MWGRYVEQISLHCCISFRKYFIVAIVLTSNKTLLVAIWTFCLTERPEYRCDMYQDTTLCNMYIYLPERKLFIQVKSHLIHNKIPHWVITQIIYVCVYYTCNKFYTLPQDRIDYTYNQGLFGFAKSEIHDSNLCIWFKSTFIPQKKIYNRYYLPGTPCGSCLVEENILHF